MRLLLVTGLLPSPTSPLRGVFVADQARLLREAGHELRAVNVLPWMPRWYARRGATFDGVSETPADYDLEEMPVRVVRFRTLPRHPLPGWTAGQMRRRAEGVMQWLDDWEPDLIHSHTLFPCAALARQLGDWLEVPVVGTVHGWDFDGALHGRPGGQIRAMVAGLDALVVVKEADVEVGRTLKAPIVEQIACHVHVDPRWCEAAGPGTSTWRQGLLGLLFPADVRRPEKDHALFEAAAAELSGRGWTVETSALGGVSREEVWQRMAAADVVVLTSLREGSPQVVKEARVVGARVASTDVGDVGSYLPAAVVARGRDAESMADAIEAALDADLKWPALPERYTAEGVLGALEALYGSLAV